jgi:hypothetical protein
MKIKTLADVRRLISHLPRATRGKSTWQHVAAELDKAAAGADTASVSAALQMVLSLERVEYRVGYLKGAQQIPEADTHKKRSPGKH